jgi:hypothetical protein
MVITQLAFTRIGVKIFEAKVNKALEEGKKLESFSIEKRGFRFICIAILN